MLSLRRIVQNHRLPLDVQLVVGDAGDLQVTRGLDVVHKGLEVLEGDLRGHGPVRCGAEGDYLDDVVGVGREVGERE